MRKHAEFSASSSHRWMNCPGSIKAQRNLEEEPSPWAQEGLVAHKQAAIIIREYIKTNKIIRCNDKYVLEYVKFLLPYINTAEKTFLEKRVKYEHLAPAGFGTVDFAVKYKNHIRVFDFKYGKGVKVEDFKQLRFYASAIGKLFNMKNIKYHMHIIQPRLGSYQEEHISAEQMKKWEKLVRIKVRKAQDPNAKRIPGDQQCKWCLAKNTCPELANYIENKILYGFDKVEAKDLSDIRKRRILDNRKLINLFIESIEHEVFERLRDGGQFKGYKLVDGRRYRRFTEKAETYLKNLLGAKAYNKKLIGITEAEKLIGKDKMEKITYKDPGRPTLVPFDDMRDSISPHDVFRRE